MKTFIFCLSVLFATGASAQSIGSYNISTTGKSAMNEDGGLYFAIGEPINTVIGDGEIIIAQGFLQVAIASGTSQTEEILLSTLKVFPNPSNYELNIELLEFTGDYNVSLFNILGQELAKTKMDTTHQKIDMSSLSPGSYYLQVYNKEKSLGSFTIIKQ